MHSRLKQGEHLVFLWAYMISGYDGKSSIQALDNVSNNYTHHSEDDDDDLDTFNFHIGRDQEEI